MRRAKIERRRVGLKGEGDIDTGEIPADDGIYRGMMKVMIGTILTKEF